MNKTIDTTMIEYSVLKHLTKTNKIFGTLEVGIDKHFRKIADFAGFNKNGTIYIVEIKTSLNDFKSDNGHNLLGHINYYAMTKELYEQVKDEIPNHVGVYITRSFDYEKTYYASLINIKQAKKVKSDLDLELIKERINTSLMSNMIRLQNNHYQNKRRLKNETIR